MADEQKIKVKINVPEAVKAGHYSNLFNLTITSGGEVIFDFAFVHPNDKDNAGEQSGTIVSRVIMPLSLAIALKMGLEAQLGKNKKE